MTPRALSLAETTVASFLLLSGFLVVARLFHSSLRYQTWIDSVTLATAIGEETTESVRAWAQTPSNFANLEAVYNPMVLQRGDVRLEIQASSAIPMASPCNELENAFPAGDRCLLRKSYKRLQVRVITSRENIDLCTLLGDPPRELRAVNPLVVRAIGASPMAHDARLSLAAAVYDSGGQEIPDVFFSWSSEPITGRGTLENIKRDGLSGEFVHKMMMPDGSYSYSPAVSGLPARCQVGAAASYRGQEVTALSPPIVLTP